MRQLDGFTLIETLVAIAIAAILMGIAVPSFSDLHANSRLAKIEGYMTSSIYRAVSESRKQRKRIVICAKLSDTTCGTEWKEGWLLFVDENDTGTRYTRDSSERIIRIVTVPKVPELSVEVTTRTAWSSLTTSTSILSLEPRGRSDSATIVICDDRGDKSSRTLALLPSGLPNNDLGENAEGKVVDVWGDVVVCSK